MPKLYEYFGIVVLFYANEHEPVHVHGKYQGRESKADIIIAHGEITAIHFTTVQYKRPLEARQQRDFEQLIRYYAEDIVQKWCDFFVHHKPITPQTITRRIKE